MIKAHVYGQNELREQIHEKLLDDFPDIKMALINYLSREYAWDPDFMRALALWGLETDAEKLSPSGLNNPEAMGGIWQ